MFSASAQIYASNEDAATLETALATVTKDVFGERTTSAARAQSLLTAETDRTDENPMPPADAFDVMVKLAEDIPPATTHDIEELEVDRRHATVHGIVDSIPEGEAIKPALANERCFEGVKLSGFHRQPGSDRQKYVLELDLRCPGDRSPSARRTPSEPDASGAGGG